MQGILESSQAPPAATNKDVGAMQLRSFVINNEEVPSRVSPGLLCILPSVKSWLTAFDG